MTAFFNGPCLLIGLIAGMMIGALTVEYGDNVTNLRENTAHMNQVIADCEANLPRNQSCELTAKVKK